MFSSACVSLEECGACRNGGPSQVTTLASKDDWTRLAVVFWNVQRGLVIGELEEATITVFGNYSAQQLQYC